MQKKQKTILIVLALFVLGALCFFLFGGSDGKVEEESIATTTAPAKSELKMETKSLSASSTNLTLYVEYPQISDAVPNSVSDTVNLLLKKKAQNTYDDTLADLKKAGADPRPDAVGWDVEFEKKLIQNKTYTNNQTNVLSVAYSAYQDTGGAHGTFFYASDAVDTQTGFELVLSDLLQGDYKTAIIKEVDNQIRTQAATCLRCDSLAGELDDLPVSVPETFVLSDQGITFLYGAYDLGSYAATASGQEVFVSKDVLAPYILRNW
jgi:hypothetical protein